MKKQHTREFSKLIMVAAGIINLCVIIFTFVMVWRTCDLTPLAYLIPSTAAEVATGTAFYYNKAKSENRLKLMKIYGIDINEQNFDGEEASYDRPYGYCVGDYRVGGGIDHVVSDPADQNQD